MTKKPTRPRKNPKTDPAAPGAPGPGHNSQERELEGRKLSAIEERELFLQHRTGWNAWRAKQAAVDKIGEEVKTALKADGFTVKQMKIADGLSGSAKAERAVVTEVEDRLRVARWIGHALGAQMDLFERTRSDGGTLGDQAALRRWYDDGFAGSDRNAPRKPPAELRPGSPEERSWFDGYDNNQEELANKVGRGKGNPFSETVAAGDAAVKAVAAALGVPGDAPKGSAG